ncbi:erythromycin esterase family protein [Pedobacter gandavensis]|uniref:erythromycin esterase family protein n=1 Tax=Pedobacter gandavensis TaxID=2679963 RepID=UPI002930D941|nr:erythromycin esterase family protein [Pedobacter gandavensis]
MIKILDGLKYLYKNNSIALAVKLGVIGLMPYQVFGQSSLIKALNENIIPLKSVEVSADFIDKNSINEVFENKNIVLLGEATHGTHEFFSMKQNIIQFLIKERGFRNFVIEADFVGSVAMNDYIVEGKGNINNALKRMSIGVWINQDFKRLIEWMKDFNLTQSAENKIKFYGCDMQFAINSAEMLLSGKLKLKTTLTPSAMKGLKTMINYSYGQIEKSELENVNALEYELKMASIDENVTENVTLFSHYLENILQTIMYSKTKYLHDKDIIRDKKMAENFEWIHNLDNKRKTIVWAHNLHVAKNSTRNNNLPMGYYIKQKHPSETYIIGFGFNNGSFNAYNENTKKYGECKTESVTSEKSVELIFSNCMSPNFFLDFETSKGNQLINKFLNERRESRGIGGSYNPSKQSAGGGGANKPLNTMYDGFIFINTTTMVIPSLN